MFPVSKPDFDTGEVYDKAVEPIRNPGLRGQMAATRPVILDLAQRYDGLAQVAQLEQLQAHPAGLGTVAGADLRNNYTYRMARKGKPARPIYDHLLSLPTHDRCPFCGHGQVMTLDHLLPKSVFPGLSVLPENLIGCCDRCNRLKGEQAPMGPDSVFPHPYFDPLDEEVWLVATVCETTPASLLFEPIQGPDIADDLFARHDYQFRALKLGQLYSDLAGEEIAALSEVLEGVFEFAGPRGVEDFLRRQASSRRRHRKNAWQAATYEALANSEWYCDEGFQL